MSDWDALWQEYTDSLREWAGLSGQMQAASKTMQSKFNNVWKKATADSSDETLKLFGQNWQKNIDEIDSAELAEFGASLKKSLDGPDILEFKQFVDGWLESLGAARQARVDSEALGQFAETWKAMWPKS